MWVYLPKEAGVHHPRSLRPPGALPLEPSARTFPAHRDLTRDWGSPLLTWASRSYYTLFDTVVLIYRRLSQHTIPSQPSCRVGIFLCACLVLALRVSPSFSTECRAASLLPFERKSTPGSSAPRVLLATIICARISQLWADGHDISQPTVPLLLKHRACGLLIPTLASNAAKRHLRRNGCFRRPMWGSARTELCESCRVHVCL